MFVGTGAGKEATSFVPWAVPSRIHISLEVVPSWAANTTRSPIAVICSGSEPSGPGSRSATGPVPSLVPSLCQGSSPREASYPAKNTPSPVATSRDSGGAQ